MQRRFGRYCSSLTARTPFILVAVGGRSSRLLSWQIEIPVNDVAYRASQAALNMVAVGERVEFGPASLKVFVVLSG